MLSDINTAVVTAHPVVKGYISVPLTELLLFCFNRGKTILDSCPYIAIMAHHWYPQQINGHKFDGKEGDSIQVPERLLEVSVASSLPGDEKCKFVQFTEYSSQQWFAMGNKEPALKNKVWKYCSFLLGSQFVSNIDFFKKL